MGEEIRKEHPKQNTVVRFWAHVTNTSDSLIPNAKKGNCPEDAPTKGEEEEEVRGEDDTAVVLNGRHGRYEVDLELLTDISWEIESHPGKFPCKCLEYVSMRLFRCFKSFSAI